MKNYNIKIGLIISWFMIFFGLSGLLGVIIGVPAYIKYNCVSRGEKLEIKSEVIEKVCSDCVGCKQLDVTPEEALDAIAEGVQPNLFTKNFNIAQEINKAAQHEDQNNRMLELENQIYLLDSEIQLMRHRIDRLEKIEKGLSQ